MRKNARIWFGVAAVVALSGCTEYMELRNTSDRIWIMTKDGTTVLRCIDTTPDRKPFAGDAKVFCKAAYMYGTVTDVDFQKPSGMHVENTCPEGKVTGADTAGHCCWPDQAWSPKQGTCIGQPQCPSGFVLRGTNCEKADLSSKGEGR
jgi:hypothetical protein